MAEVDFANGDNLYFGNGAVYVAELDADKAPLGERFVGNCTLADVTPEPNVIEKRNRTGSARGVFFRKSLATNVFLALSMDEATKENLQLELHAGSSAATQGAGTVTDESIGTAWEFGLWYPLDYKSLSSVVVEHVVDALDVALTVDVDYKIDLVEGRIMLISGGDGAAVESELLKISYSYAAVTGKVQLSVGTQAVQERYLRFVGFPSNGPAYNAEFWRVAFEASGAVSLIQSGDENATWQLKGTVLDDTEHHASMPFGRVWEK